MWRFSIVLFVTLYFFCASQSRATDEENLDYSKSEIYEINFKNHHAKQCSVKTYCPEGQHCCSAATCCPENVECCGDGLYCCDTDEAPTQPSIMSMRTEEWEIKDENL